MNNSKLPHAIIGTFVAWGFRILAWAQTHENGLATGMALLASGFTIASAVQSMIYKYKEAQRRKRDMDSI